MPKNDSKAEGGSPGDKLLLRALGPAADELGHELAPLGREVGEVGVRAARALLRPLSGIVWGYEQIEGWVADALGPKVERIPPEQRIEPKLVVAGPILDSMRYCGSEPHLRDLFANLLATAMDARFAPSAHPAFVEMVKQLAPDEARMLSFMGRGFASLHGQVIVLYRTWKSLEEMPDGTSPAYQSEVFGPYARAAYYAGCKHLSLVPSYVSNLCRLEIFKLEFPAQLNPQSVQDLLNDDLIKQKRREIDGSRGGDRCAYNTGMLDLTPLGAQFLDACVRDRNLAG